MYRPDKRHDDPTSEEWGAWLIYKLRQEITKHHRGFKYTDMEEITGLQKSRLVKIIRFLRYNCEIENHYVDGRQATYFLVGQQVPKKSLSPKQQKVFDYLSSIGAKNGFISATLRQIGKHTGLHHGNLPSTINDLVFRKKRISVDHAGIVGGNYGQVTRPNRYKIRPESEWA